MKKTVLYCNTQSEKIYNDSNSLNGDASELGNSDYDKENYSLYSSSSSSSSSSSCATSDDIPKTQRLLFGLEELTALVMLWNILLMNLKFLLQDESRARVFLDDSLDGDDSEVHVENKVCDDEENQSLGSSCCAISDGLSIPKTRSLPLGLEGLGVEGPISIDTNRISDISSLEGPADTNLAAIKLYFKVWNACTVLAMLWNVLAMDWKRLLKQEYSIDSILIPSDTISTRLLKEHEVAACLLGFDRGQIL